MTSTPLLLRIGHWFYVNTRFGRWYFNRSIDQVANELPQGHTNSIIIDYDNFHVRIVPYSRDNYGFIIWRDYSDKCIIVDPGYFPPFKEALQQLHLILDSVFITHKHVDHCGGLAELVQAFPNARIYGHKLEKIKYVTNTFESKIYRFIVCEDNGSDVYPIVCTAYNVPGHTLGHTVYSINTNPCDKKYSGDLHNIPPALVFTGDCIFVGSVGAMFETSTNTNLVSLRFLIKNLLKLGIPSDRVYFFSGHEYSIDSLQFIICNCTPKSESARKKLEWAIEQRNWHLPTIPASLFEEISYSPYLRIACATRPNQPRVPLLHSKHTTLTFLPTIQDLLNELLLTDKFIRTHIRPVIQLKSSTHRKNKTSSGKSLSSSTSQRMRVDLFDDMFNAASRKSLLTSAINTDNIKPIRS